MFVQLRRVVYLLVLLQCCVYVVNASGGGAGLSHDNANGSDDTTKVKEELMRLERQSFPLFDGLESVGVALRARVSKASVALSNAREAVKKAKELIQEARAGTQIVETADKGSGAKDLKEVAQKAQESVAAAGEALEVMNEYYDYAVDQKENGSNATEAFNRTLVKYSAMVKEDKDEQERLVYVAESLKNLRKSLEGLKGAIRSAEPKKVEIKNELKILNESLKQIDESIKNMPLPQLPQTTGRQEVGGTKEVVTPERNTAQGGATPPKGTEGVKGNSQSENTGVNTMTNNGNSGEQQSHGEGVGNNQSALQDNVTTNEPKGNENTKTPENDIPNKQNETHNHKNEERSEKGKPNGAGDSQKPTTPSNTASGTVNTGSGGVTSGSHSSSSSGTINFNVSGLSDGSSSPALLHSPLMLLLLCVLGSVLVF